MYIMIYPVSSNAKFNKVVILGYKAIPFIEIDQSPLFNLDRHEVVLVSKRLYANPYFPQDLLFFYSLQSGIK